MKITTVSLIKVITLTFTLLASAPSVFAEKKASTKKAKASKTEAPKAKEKESDEASDDAAPAKVNFDEEELNNFVAGKEKKLSQNRQRRITRMRKIITKNPQHRQKERLLFQIAELCEPCQCFVCPFLIVLVIVKHI